MPDPSDVARFDAQCRELFGPGVCTEAFHRSRQPNIPARRVEVEQLERGIYWRVRLWRAKRALRSREVWLTFVALLLASAFMAGRVFAGQQKDQAEAGAAEPAAASGVTGAGVAPSPASGQQNREQRRAAARVRRVNAGLGATHVDRRDVRERPEPCPSLVGDSALPLVSRERFEECRAQALRESVRLRLYLGVCLSLAVLSAIGVLLWIDKHAPEWFGEPQDEGCVLPPRGRW